MLKAYFFLLFTLIFSLNGYLLLVFLADSPFKALHIVCVHPFLFTFILLREISNKQTNKHEENINNDKEAFVKEERKKNERNHLVNKKK